MSVQCLDPPGLKVLHALARMKAAMPIRGTGHFSLAKKHISALSSTPHPGKQSQVTQLIQQPLNPVKNHLPAGNYLPA